MTISTFPVLIGLTAPLDREAIWSTASEESVSGQTEAYGFWSYPRYQYSLSFSVLRTAVGLVELQTLMAFRNQLSGPADVFQFKDDEDYVATTQNLAIGDGTNHDFQLQRSFGGYYEPVYAPVTVTQVRLNGTPTAAYTLLDGGIIHFTSAPGAGVQPDWTGTFNWLCRFDEDRFKFTRGMPGYWAAKDLTFTTVKL